MADHQDIPRGHGGDEDAIAAVVEQLNAGNTTDAWWYATEVPLSPTARETGRLRRVELWLLTPDAARTANLIV